MLAALVKEGKLPPLAERLPKTPFVTTPFKETGTYGGDLRFGFAGDSAPWGGLLYIIGWENPMMWKPDYSGVVPGILESLTPNEDSSVWTAKTREGMKWSDGDPYDAEDIAFYVQDMMMDADLSPDGVSADWLPGEMAKEFKFEVVDQTTVKFIFPTGYGTFPMVLAQWQGRQFAMYPKHFLSQYHKKYNEKIDELVTKEGEESWMALFFKRAPANWGDPDVAFFKDTNYPTLSPWRLTQPRGGGTTLGFERNPYYWRVDDKGNQLPYIDTMTATSFQDDTARVLSMLSGQLDVIKDISENTRPQFIEAMDKGIVQINRTKPGRPNEYILDFNMTHLEKGVVFSDINFRIGVSYAINRTEMIELFADGLGKPAQVCPLESSPLYVERCNTQYIEYDVAKANEYLDKVLPNKGSDGMRLGPDGKPFNIILTAVLYSWQSDNDKRAEKTAEYLKAVGLNVIVNVLPEDQYELVYKANQTEAFLSTPEGAAPLDSFLDPRSVIPVSTFSVYGLGWYLHREVAKGATDMSNQVEPPQWMKDMILKYNKAITQPTEAGQLAIMKELVEEATDRFFHVGGWTAAEGFYPWNVRVGNIPEEFDMIWLGGTLKVLYPEQWYLKQ